MLCVLPYIKKEKHLTTTQEISRKKKFPRMEASRRGLITRCKSHRSLSNALYQNNLAPIVCSLFLAFVLFCFLFASLLIVTLIVISLISKWIKIPGLTPEITLCWFWDRPPLYVLRFETSLSLFGLPRSRTVVPSHLSETRSSFNAFVHGGWERIRGCVKFKLFG